MQTNDTKQQTSQNNTGGFGGSSQTKTDQGGETKKKSIGDFLGNYRSLTTAVPSNRHNTAERQDILVKAANNMFSLIADLGGENQLAIKAENYYSSDFEGVYPATAFIHETAVPNRQLYVYFISHETPNVVLENRRLGNGGFGNQVLEVPSTVADVVNDIAYQRKLKEAIARRKGVPVENVAIFQGFYLPKEQSMVHALEDGHEDAQRVGQYIHRVYNCFYTLMNSARNELCELNLASLTDNIMIRHEVSELPGYDIAGNPFRSDIVSRLSVSSNERKESIAVSKRDDNLVQAHAYIDAAIPNSEPNVSRNGETVRQAVIPHVIITKITSDSYHDHRTLMLGLLAAFGIGDRTTRPWISPLRLQPAGRGINTRDMGAFGLDRRINLVNPPQFLPTQNGNLSDDELRRLLSAVFVDDEIVYSVDVEELSDDAWLMQTLQDAANNVDDARAICDWVNELTNGIFYQKFDLVKDGGVIASWNMRLPSGYHIDAEGIKRDTTRTYDWLGIMNSVVAPNENKYDGSEIGLLISNIFTNEQLSETERYVEWRNLVLPNVPGFVQTGWFRRFKFNSVFVSAFIESVILALASKDSDGRGAAELINVPPAHGLEHRTNYRSNMFQNTNRTMSFNNGGGAGFGGGGFGGTTTHANNSRFFNRNDR